MTKNIIKKDYVLREKYVIIITDAIKITNNELYELKKDPKINNNLWNILPKYTIGNNNNLISSEFFLQFAGDIIEKDDKEFILFNIETLSSFLIDEFSDEGVETFFHYLTNDLKLNLNDLISNLDDYLICCEKFSKFRYIEPTYFSVEIEFYNDFNYKIIGFEKLK